MRSVGRFIAAALIVTACGASSLSADEKTDKIERVRRLIGQLDDDRFSRRAEATAALLEIGEAALPLLQQAARSKSREVRYRAQRIVYFMVTARIRKELAELGRVENDEQIDVERGMWLIARIVDPLVRQQDLDGQLDRLATRVRQRLQQKFGKDVDPKRVSPTAAVAALGQVLFIEASFSGNEKDYDNPINSSLHSVLKTRQGLPILLSHVVIAVARRLEIPIVGLGLSGRYMCMYDGSQAPDGRADNIVIDPFGAGRILSQQELSEVIPAIGPNSSLSPDGNRSALLRMLVNLANDYDAIGDGRMAAQVHEFRALLYPVEAAP